MISRVTRSKVEPAPREILGNKVLVNKNPRQVAVEEDTLWEYDQEQYNKDEYIKKIDTDREELSNVVADLTEVVIGGL